MAFESIKEQMEILNKYMDSTDKIEKWNIILEHRLILNYLDWKMSHDNSLLENEKELFSEITDIVNSKTDLRVSQFSAGEYGMASLSVYLPTNLVVSGQIQFDLFYRMGSWYLTYDVRNGFNSRLKNEYKILPNDLPNDEFIFKAHNIIGAMSWGGFVDKEYLTDTIGDLVDFKRYNNTINNRKLIFGKKYSDDEIQEIIENIDSLIEKAETENELYLAKTQVEFDKINNEIVKQWEDLIVNPIEEFIIKFSNELKEKGLPHKVKFSADGLIKNIFDEVKKES